MADHKQILELMALRDFLTEAILRADRTFFRHPAFGASKPGILKKMGQVEFYGVEYVGFGVGIEPDKRDAAALYIFVDPSFKGKMPELMEDLSKNFELPIVCRKGRFEAAARPVEGGHSIGHGSTSGETGTMGCVVKNKSGDRFGLTCNHVIADLNNAVRGTTKVWSPGSGDGGTSSDLLGVVHDYVPLAFGGSYNDVDAALAKPNAPSDLDPIVHGIGTVNGWTSTINFGDEVQKSGVETGVTNGKYRLQVNGLVTFAGGKTALFQNLLGIIGTSTTSDFAEKGDSGAVVLNDNSEIVGQVISVTTDIDLTLASPIEPVMKQLQVEPV
jgi:hypothetical protein